MRTNRTSRACSDKSCSGPSWRGRCRPGRRVARVRATRASFGTTGATPAVGGEGAYHSWFEYAPRIRHPSQSFQPELKIFAKSYAEVPVPERPRGGRAPSASPSTGRCRRRRQSLRADGRAVIESSRRFRSARPARNGVLSSFPPGLLGENYKTKKVQVNDVDHTKDSMLQM
ncbi:hypothetical protein EVAR_65654_1 [Eumeta japonica]|uniref:Uncharacterized protein n=1 Tax=Eumeta variegata TaxID=151549 RepID=A0A4C1Z4N9_EUMVA|nr:hypothetical protein EVAR_65654_1 [Eumeta japonica]